jgi:hypothetical protein
MAISAAQIVIGAVIIYYSAGTLFKIGDFFIAEGISDAIYLISSSINGDLNNKDYLHHKSISMSISLTIGSCKFIYSAMKYGMAANSFGKVAT